MTTPTKSDRQRTSSTIADLSRRAASKPAGVQTDEEKEVAQEAGLAEGIRRGALAAKAKAKARGTS